MSTVHVGTTPASTKVRFGAAIERDLAEAARDAVVALGPGWTLTRLIEEAVAEKVARLAELSGSHGGFPRRRRSHLQPGRRIDTRHDYEQKD